MISTILLYFAVVFAFIAAVFAEKVERASFSVHFGWLSIAFWILSVILAGVR
jgi:hypothetical protein